MRVADTAVEIIASIRAAVGHERAATGHEDKYEQQMKSAGASMFHAFTLAIRSAPVYQGRKLDDGAVLRIYKSTSPRLWWDEALTAAKVLDGKGRVDRDHAKRLIQWHVDLDGARSRRAQHSLSVVASRKRVEAGKVKTARGSTLTPESAPSTQEFRSLGGAGGDGADLLLAAGENAASVVSIEDLLGEVSRLQVAAKKVEVGHRADALEALRNAARELERYVP